MGLPVNNTARGGQRIANKYILLLSPIFIYENHLGIQRLMGLFLPWDNINYVSTNN